MVDVGSQLSLELLSDPFEYRAKIEAGVHYVMMGVLGVIQSTVGGLGLRDTSTTKYYAEHTAKACPAMRLV